MLTGTANSVFRCSLDAQLIPIFHSSIIIIFGRKRVFFEFPALFLLLLCTSFHILVSLLYNSIGKKYQNEKYRLDLKIPIGRWRHLFSIMVEKRGESILTDIFTSQASKFKKIE